jgi:hypothetical protein
MTDNVPMLPASRLTAALLALTLLAGCARTEKTPEIKQVGVFTMAFDKLVEIRKFGTLAESYGPRLYPEIPDYDVPAVPFVGPIYINNPEIPAPALKGIEWHGYRLGGNGSVGSRSTATAEDWKAVPVVIQQTPTTGLFKVVVAAADPSTGRWKPEQHHEYFGLTVDGGYKGGPVWAVRIK